MECSCPPACTVCAQSTPRKELIADRLVWHEPFDAIASLFRVSVLDLERHSVSDSGVSDIRSTDFPFFENSGFLLLGPANCNTYDYLAWTRERVRRPVRETDKGFCVLVGLMADHFLQKSNFQTFLDYSDYFAITQKLVGAVNIEEIPDEYFLSDDGLNRLPDQWLITHGQPGRGLANLSQEWQRIRTYGHGAVTLHQIAVLADKEPSGEGIRLLYTDDAKLRWAERACWAWLRLRFWLQRPIPVMRTKKRIDIAYHALRTSHPFDPPEAAPLRREVKKLAERKKVNGGLAPEDSDRLKKAREAIDKMFNSELAQLASAEIDHELKPLIYSRKYEKTPHDEIASIANTAVGEAVVKDRTNTPSRDWYLKLWRDFENSRPAPIIVRVRRDITDYLRHEWKEKNVARGLGRDAMRDILEGKFRAGEQIRPGVYRAEGSETSEDWKRMRVGNSTILENINVKKQAPWKLTETEMVIMKDQVCKTPEERVIWQAKIEDPQCDLDQLQGQVYSETGKDLTVQRIWQIASKLQKRARGINSSR